MLHHLGLINNARFVAMRGGAIDHNTWLSAIPLFHSSGSGLGVLGAVQTIGTQVLVPQFIPNIVLELLETYHVDIAPMVPTMINAIFSHPDFPQRNLSDLRKVWSGGTNVPPDVVRQVEETTRVRFSTVFGQTEASPIITQTHPEDSIEDKTLTVGQPLPQTEVKIVDPNTDIILPVNEAGELCTRGYLVMEGYFNWSEATNQTIDHEGWLHTGDLCAMDDRGYVRVEGRIKDLVIRGGENIYPKEVEDVLLTHPDVVEAALVGIPDSYWGEQSAAFVQLVPGSTITLDELQTFVKALLASYKVPRYWRIIDQFPRTPLGKIQKFLLREQFMEPPQN
jgi:fatty-acyl-CoA synthase